jgi:molecular chaperone HtpG
LITPHQTDKEGKLIYLYATQPEEQHLYIEAARNKGYDIIWMDGVIDSHFVNFLESKLEKSSFVRVDADTIDKLIQKDEEIPSKLSEEQQNSLKGIAENLLDKQHYQISIASLNETETPVMVTRPEFMRRMKEMSAMGGGYGFMGEMPDSYQVIINGNHPLIQRIVSEQNPDSQKNMLQHTLDLGLLAQGLLKGESLSRFMKRSIDLLA